jgi:hypothetical protein
MQAAKGRLAQDNRLRPDANLLKLLPHVRAIFGHDSAVLD